MGNNFTNGSLVLRVWRFDGGSEVLAKFQYFGDAKDFAQFKAAKDEARLKDYFYLAVCDCECEATAFGAALSTPKEAPHV